MAPIVLSVEDISVRLVLLLHIHLIVFSFLGLHTVVSKSSVTGSISITSQQIS